MQGALFRLLRRVGGKALRPFPMLRRRVAMLIPGEHTPPVKVASAEAAQAFIAAMKAFTAPEVIELGTRRSVPEIATRHDFMVPHAARYVGVDIEAGIDVDVVADAHALSRHFGAETIDAVVSCSTFEHLQYPWIAAAEIAKVLRLGGIVYLQTHQTFVLHAYPHDYWRFSTECLRSLFSPRMGFEVLSCHYEFPCRIESKDVPDSRLYPSFLNVAMVARKVGPSPPAFVPDLASDDASPSQVPPPLAGGG